MIWSLQYVQNSTAGFQHNFLSTSGEISGLKGLNPSPRHPPEHRHQQGTVKKFISQDTGTGSGMNELKNQYGETLMSLSSTGKVRNSQYLFLA